MGYIDNSGRFVIAPRFIGASEFHDGLAYAGGGFIDNRSTKVILGPFTGATSFADDVAAVQADYKGWGYIDKHGGWLAQPNFDQAGAMQDGVCKVLKCSRTERDR